MSSKICKAVSILQVWAAYGFSETMHDWVIFELDIYNAYDKGSKKYFVQVLTRYLFSFNIQY